MDSPAMAIIAQRTLGHVLTPSTEITGKVATVITGESTTFWIMTRRVVPCFGTTDVGDRRETSSVRCSAVRSYASQEMRFVEHVSFMNVVYVSVGEWVCNRILRTR